MTENKWTQEREKRFWEYFGFKQANIRWNYHYERGVRVADWLYPDGTFHRELPDITDLNALFKWAVPKVQDMGYSVELIAHHGKCNWEEGNFQCRIATPNDFCEMGNIFGAITKDPAQALAEALEKALTGGKNG